jgi:hypothetical protein
MVASNWQSETRVTIDGYVLNEQPPEVFSSGAQARVPVMLGFLADEDEQFPRYCCLFALDAGRIRPFPDTGLS